MTSTIAAAPTAEDRRATHVALLGWATLARYRPEPEWEARHGPVVLHASGRPGPELNYVLVLGEAPPERVLGEAARFFGAGARYSVVVEVAAAPLVDAALREGGWRLDEEEPALALAPLPDRESVPPPAELTIRRVDDAASFEAFFRVSGATAPGSGQVYVPTLAAARDPDVALLLGTVGGEVVATARVACATSDAAPRLTVAEINGVATLPAYRRRGYGTAMTWAAVQAGARRGATAAVLHASEMGAPLYRRMGFREAGTYRTYVPPEA